MVYVEYTVFKELRVQDGRLVSSDNEVISTVPAIDIISGVSDNTNLELESDTDARRLQFARRLSSGSYTIDISSVLSVTPGAHVVPLPDGTIRTVHVAAVTSNPVSANGYCYSCNIGDGPIYWDVKCITFETNCTVFWHIDESTCIRRLQARRDKAVGKVGTTIFER